MSFGAAVKRAREARSWTQAALGSAVGVSSAQISRIESGERDPSFELGLEIARVLDIDLNHLKASEDSPSPSDEEAPTV